MTPPTVSCPFCSSTNVFPIKRKYTGCSHCNLAFRIAVVKDPYKSSFQNFRDNLYGILGFLLIPGFILLIYYQHTYVWETPFIGHELQAQFFDNRNHPEWLLDYTNNPAVLYNITWHYDSLKPCSEDAIVQGPIGRHTSIEGLYKWDTAICTKDPQDKLRPSCNALHELAHAIDFTKREGTYHDDSFYLILDTLHQMSHTTHPIEPACLLH